MAVLYLMLILTAAALPMRVFAQSAPNTISGLQFWYEPSQSGGAYQDTAKTTPCTTDGQAIACLPDLSGNGYDMTQATTANQPVYRTTGAGFSQPCARFNGTSSTLSLANNTTLNTALSSSSITVFFVVYMNNGGGTLLSKQTGFGDGRLNFFSTYAAWDRWQYDIPLGTSVLGTQGNFVRTLMTYRLTLTNAASSPQFGMEELFANGVRVGREKWGILPAWDFSSAWTIGAALSSHYWGGDVAAIACYGRALTAPEMTSVSAYWAARYGFTMGGSYSPSGSVISPSVRVLGCGNSLTQGFDAFGLDWLTDIQKSGTFPQADFYNLSITGINTPAMQTNQPSLVLPAIAPGQTNIAFCWELTNDLTTGASVQAAHDHMASYCQVMKSANCRVAVIDCLSRSTNSTTLTAIHSCNALFRADFPVPARNQLGQVISGLYLPKPGISYADLFIDLAGDPSIGPDSWVNGVYNAGDQTHLTPAGQSIVAGYNTAALSYLLTPAHIVRRSVSGGRSGSRASQ